MKKIICYIVLFISILCLQVRYAVAGSNVELTSQRSGWLVEKTNHGEGTYFIADFVLAKKNSGVWDIIIVDTKLSASTSLTDNQNNAQNMTQPYNVKSSNFVLISGVRPDPFVTQILHQKPFVIIYSNGSGTYGGIK